MALKSEREKKRHAYTTHVRSECRAGEGGREDATKVTLQHTQLYRNNAETCVSSWEPPRRSYANTRKTLEPTRRPRGRVRCNRRSRKAVLACYQGCMFTPPPPPSVNFTFLTAMTGWLRRLSLSIVPVTSTLTSDRATSKRARHAGRERERERRDRDQPEQGKNVKHGNKGQAGRKTLLRTQAESRRTGKGIEK